MSQKSAEVGARRLVGSFRPTGYMFRWLIAVAVPSIALAVLLRNPSLDVRWELPWAHLYLVTGIGLMGVILSLLITRVAVHTQNARIVILALAFFAIGIFLVVHALSTPGTLIPFPSTGSKNAIIIGFLLCSVLLAASGPTLPRRWQRVSLEACLWLFPGITLLALLIAALALVEPNFLIGVQKGKSSALIMGGWGATNVVLLSTAIVPHYRDFRLTGLSFHHAMVTGLLLLQVAVAALVVSLTWYVRWWEYHFLLFGGLGVILSGVLREAARRSDLLEVFATLLVGDTVGKLEHSYTEVLHALVDLVEARDRYTHGHSTRVARLSVTIGEAMGLSPEQLRNLHQAAVIHDLGKISVQDTLLNKPGALSVEEFALVAAHTVVGDQLVSRVPPLSFARPGIRWHHERLDGSGYPDGLKGEAIPLEARIIAVADVYDAMTSQRAYRAAVSPDTALAELRQHAGRKYDLRAVTALVECLKEHAEGVHTEDASGMSRRALASPSGGATAGAAEPRPLGSSTGQDFAARGPQALSGLMAVAQRLLHPLELQTVLQHILGQIETVFGHQVCSVFLVDRTSGKLLLKAQKGYDLDFLGAARGGMGKDGIVERVAATGKPDYTPDVRREPGRAHASSRVRSEVALPLIVGDEVIGVLAIGSAEIDGFRGEVRSVLEAFGTLAALAIARAQRDEELKGLALRDSLTGLANHRGLWEALDREIAHAARLGQSISAILFELDGFKRVNDRYGHLRGDEVLRAVADILKGASRASDIVARFGGDEFVIVFPEMPKTAAVEVAERIRRRVEELTLGFPLAASIGVAGFPEDGATTDALLEAADRAMYRAKGAGGNLVLAS
jgi:diguanylate cyclase (GGDEF)-like protein